MKDLKIAHISATKRSDGDYTGVPKFAHYLQRAIGCDILTPNENVDKYDVLICDGQWANKYKNKTDKLIISIVHGVLEYRLKLINGNMQDAYIPLQKSVFINDNIKKVAVSKSANEEMKELYGKSADIVINNCVDGKIFKPNENIDNSDEIKILYSTHRDDFTKANFSLLGELIDEMQNDKIKFVEMTEKSCDLKKEAYKIIDCDLYLNPSRHEGNSFAVLEAMMCGLPGVYSNVGYLNGTYGVQDYGIVLDIDDEKPKWKLAILDLIQTMHLYNPREYAINNFDFSIFKKQWVEVIEKWTKK